MNNLREERTCMLGEWEVVHGWSRSSCAFAVHLSSGFLSIRIYNSKCKCIHAVVALFEWCSGNFECGLSVEPISFRERVGSIMSLPLPTPSAPVRRSRRCLAETLTLSMNYLLLCLPQIINNHVCILLLLLDHDCLLTCLASYVRGAWGVVSRARHFIGVGVSDTRAISSDILPYLRRKYTISRST